MILYYKKLRPEAVGPTRAHSGDAGWDICSQEHHVLEPTRRHLFKTGLVVSARDPHGVTASHYLRLAPKSGLALKHGIDVLGGVIDQDYRGELGVILVNHGQVRWIVTPGDKICQLIPTLLCSVSHAGEIEEFANTDRGSGGFGSSGV